MQWPPKMSWTSIQSYKGFNHFVAINYGISGKKKWVNLVSVLDSKVRFRVDWEDLKDSSQWICGWVNSALEDTIQKTDIKGKSLKEELDSKICLHPSLDSGLLVPFVDIEARDWY
tara:strand:+ start:2776 stop:3120 length:345 start_codon:yes stop_codon:yes gene_type:complete